MKEKKMKVKRICPTNSKLNRSTAKKVLAQLKKNPEVCEECEIKPCVFAEYIWGCCCKDERAKEALLIAAFRKDERALEALLAMAFRSDFPEEISDEQGAVSW